MIVYLDGRFLPEHDAVIPVSDRSFLYGDGLFETLRVYDGRPFRWSDHWRRLAQGAAVLGLQPPLSETALYEAARELIDRNALPDSVLRLTLSRGSGPRGYSTRGADQPRLVMSLHPAPDLTSGSPVWRLATSTLRVMAGDPLAALKTCNKLPQILARREAEARDADEALLLNTHGEVAEASSANLFWVEGETVCTPPLDAGILPGVTRAVILEISRDAGLATREQTARIETLLGADGVFLTLSTLEIVEVSSLDGRTLRRSPVPGLLHRAYRDRVRSETRAAG